MLPCWYSRGVAHRAFLALCRQKVAQEGAEALPSRIVIVTGKSRSKEDDAGTAAKEAIVLILGACNSPFQVQTAHEAHRTEHSLGSTW